MRSSEITEGRRWLVVLEPGEELVAALTGWAGRNDVRQATLSFFGAFRWMRLIASAGPVDDPEQPSPDVVDVRYLEGLGSGSIAPSADGVPVVHLHGAAGVKGAGAAAFSGHVIGAEVHYTVEVAVREVLLPAFVLREDPRAFGLRSLHFS